MAQRYFLKMFEVFFDMPQHPVFGADAFFVIDSDDDRYCHSSTLSYIPKINKSLEQPVRKSETLRTRASVWPVHTLEELNAGDAETDNLFLSHRNEQYIFLHP
jgi:hypothetical protein